MNSDVISLSRLHDWAKRFKKQTGTLSALKIDGALAPGRDLMKICVELTSKIPDERGFYLWGNYANRGLWESVYLGKAGFGKSSNLRKRILEELKDERCLIWGNFCSPEEVFRWGAQLYPPSQWVRYEKGWKRSIKKSRATHIVWVAAPRGVQRRCFHR